MPKVYRLYTERKDRENFEVTSLLNEIKNIQGNENISQVRILNRYDVEGLNDEMFATCRHAIFAEPFTDEILEKLPDDADKILAVEFLPGQYDQRADAAEQCAMLLLGFRPIVKTARVYLFYGDINNFDGIKKFLINPVEAREASLELVVRDGGLGVKDIKFIELEKLTELKNLAMSREDLECCKKYFESEKRNPTETEIKVLDTYWSDHCRHTTFSTHIEEPEINDEKILEVYENYLSIRKKLGYPENKPVTLMDIATIGAKYLKSQGKLPDLVSSEENNACTVKINVDVDGEEQSWLLLFKNETHNHPTEIEPFGGAATCIGGAIRDPLSGRAYVYQAMRITGAASPFNPTMPGKLSQRSIITKAAAGYSSYGNQIGIPTGLVDEIYHEGYKAKRLEVGAVIAAVPEKNVIREKPSDGDLILLLGGKTGRDGIGGATGSSVSHNSSFIETRGAEVQKGNAPEERKLQRLFRNPDFTKLIKRCNDFGAGGVSVAVGELADGLDINLDAVPLKYAGLDGTEIAVSESQERMAVVVAEKDAERVKNLALSEDVQATVIARVNNSGRMRMTWRGKEIVNLSREFINSNGAARRISVRVRSEELGVRSEKTKDKNFLSDLNICSKRGLAERFDSTVGAHSVLMPFGGKFQKTPAQAMAAKIPVGNHETETCSVMSWGFDPYISEKNTFNGAYLAVLESLCKIIATGADLKKCWLTFQEYFGKPGENPERWGLPFGALLGALKAQLDFEVAAIGGKDSMSGSFTDINGKNFDVPPTLISFAVAVTDVKKILSPEFKCAGSKVILLEPSYDERGLPEKKSMLKIFDTIGKLNSDGKILACSVPTFGGVKAAIFKMCLGNNLGFEFTRTDFDERRGKFIIEISDDVNDFPVLGRVIEEPEIIFDGEKIILSEAEEIYNSPLENIFPTEITRNEDLGIRNEVAKNNFSPLTPTSCLLTPACFLIPVFAGTNCEYETAKAIEKAGGRAKIFVVRTLTPELMKTSAQEFADALKKSQALVLPGGFSNGDEPDGSGKFIAIFLRSPAVREALENLIDKKGGLVCGICNGFQALIKTGLLPFGRICEPDELSATLTFNRIGRHQSRIIFSRVIQNHSAWLRKTKIGEVYSIPISHGEGRFECSQETLEKLMCNGQIAGQYADIDGNPSMLTQYNPSGSFGAVECLTSPDGRIIGRMGHVERNGLGLYKNVPGNYGIKFFESAVEFLKN
ncbi:MAG: phosphoribosylformylglycinamidine synthase [Synergistales bacterium]|nr:phosphoribosylformylglycinamidine synthase [Synergistales bacterium]MDY6414947.1 phosphoribosylformylglycinamidine synthase [Synergistales bacterium]